MVVPQSVTYNIINDPEVPLLGIYVRACKIYVQIECYIWILILCRKAQMSINNKWMYKHNKHNIVCSHYRISIYGTTRMSTENAKRRKLDTKGHIVLFIWKTNNKNKSLEKQADKRLSGVVQLLPPNWNLKLRFTDLEGS